MANEEIILRLNMMQQEAGKIEEQIQNVNQQMRDMEVLKNSLNNLGNGKEILANLGKGIFIKSKIEDEKLFVNIGSGIVVRKNIKDTGEVITRQIGKLEEMKKQLLHEIEHINHDMINIVEEVQNKEE
jgi:prefoldin alpha subunit